MVSLAENIASVKDRIQQATKDANSPAKFPRIIAVSKTRSAHEVQLAAVEGLTDFGENYLQEALEKISETSALELTWHFIGLIQSNKTKAIAEHFDWVQSVDRLKIARRLSEQRPADLSPLQICLQVNLDSEESKSGVAPEMLFELAKQVAELSQLRLRGIMCIPAPQIDFDQQLETCKRAFKLYERLKQRHPDIDTLSLGMSADLEAAIIAGSTMVRIGTDIFGPRAKSDKN